MDAQDRERLKPWFDDSQIDAYFGARSKREIDSVVSMLQRMNTRQRKAFIREIRCAWASMYLRKMREQS